MKTEQKQEMVSSFMKAVVFECIKLKLSIRKIGTWIWIDSINDDDKKQWLISKGFSYSKGKDKYYLKGYDAISDWGHYTPVQFDNLIKKYEGKKLNSKNYLKILN